MKLRVGDHLIVKKVYGGGNFKVGDVLEVKKVEDCGYGCISPYDGIMWYLEDGEVERIVYTNGDKIRSMSDEELSKFLNHYAHDGYMNPSCGWYNWLKKPKDSW